MEKLYQQNDCFIENHQTKGCSYKGIQKHHNLRSPLKVTSSTPSSDITVLHFRPILVKQPSSIYSD